MITIGIRLRGRMTLSLLGDDMEESGPLEAFDFFQDFDEQMQVVTIDRAEITEPQLFKKPALQDAVACRLQDLVQVSGSRVNGPLIVVEYDVEIEIEVSQIVQSFLAHARGHGPVADDHHLGYFENEFGEQFVLEINRSTGEGILQSGDLGWDCKIKIRDNEIPGDVVLGADELEWLSACWRAATGCELLPLAFKKEPTDADIIATMQNRKWSEETHVE